MGYNVSKWKVLKNKDLLERMDDALESGKTLYFEPQRHRTMSALQHQLNELLKSAQMYDEYGFSHLRKALSVGVDVDEKAIRVYPKGMGTKESLPSPTTGMLRLPSKALQIFAKSHFKMDTIEFRIPEGIDWEKRKDILYRRAEAMGIQLGDLVYDEKDGVQFCRVLAEKQSRQPVDTQPEPEEEERPSIFDRIGGDGPSLARDPGDTSDVEGLLSAEDEETPPPPEEDSSHEGQ